MKGTVYEEKVQELNVASHVIGFPILLTVASRQSNLQQLFFLIVCFAILCASSAYHAWSKKSHWFRRVDRTAILVSVPIFMRLLLDPVHSAAASYLSGFSVVFFGIQAIKSLTGTEDDENNTNVAILILSWICAFLLVGTSTFPLFVLGGICYSIGLIAYMLDKRWPMLHVAWHLCVLAGMACHMSSLIA